MLSPTQLLLHVPRTRSRPVVPARTEDSAYLPGRFRAHPRPTSPAPSTPNVRNLGLSALTLSSDAPPVAPKLENKRARALKRTLDALSPDRRRRRELEAEREGLVSPWLTRIGGGVGEAQTLAAAERSPILGRHDFAGAYYAAHAASASAATADEDEEDRGLLRPGRRKVEGWMSSWWRRWFLLVGTPCLIVRTSHTRYGKELSDILLVARQVWLWAAVPFPVTDPYKEEPPWRESCLLTGGVVRANVRRPSDLPWPPIKALYASSRITEDLPVDANFLFFLFFCGCSFRSLHLFAETVNYAKKGLTDCSPFNRLWRVPRHRPRFRHQTLRPLPPQLVASLAWRVHIIRFLLVSRSLRRLPAAQVSPRRLPIEEPGGPSG